MSLVLIIDGVVLAGFAVLLVLLFRVQRNLLGHPARVFLGLFGFVYLVLGVVNLLRHGGVIESLARYEHYLELFFPPLFLFFLLPIFALYIFSVFMRHDLFQRLQAEEAIRESEARYRDLFDNSIEGRCLIRDRRVVLANHALARLLGVEDRRQLAGAEILAWVEEDERRTFLRWFQEEGRGLGQYRRRFPIRRADGERRQVEILRRTVDTGETQLVFHDVTREYQARQLLRQAKLEWERTFDTVPDLVVILDAEGRVVRGNRAFLEAAGRPERAVVGRDLVEIFPEAQLLPCGGDLVAEEGDYLVSMSCLRDDGRVLGYVRVARDIHQLKETQRELQRTRAFLQAVIDGVADAILVIDPDYRVVLMNRAVSEMHAVPQETHLPCYYITHQRQSPCGDEDHPCPLREVLADGATHVVTHRHLRHDGSTYVQEIAASPVFDQDGEIIAVVEVGRDITEKLRLAEERQRMETRVQQQQKERSIAALARGMAHDFNNLLGTVQGSLELLTGEVEDENRTILERAAAAAGEMVRLTNQLLAYAREGRYQDRLVAPATVVAEALDLARVRQYPGIEVRLEVTDEPWECRADPGQLMQMLAGLLVNAVEAMQGEGKLTVRLANDVDRPEWECQRHELHPAGDYLHLTISDTGGGIDPTMEPRLFEPFTSDKGLGRGLGLAAAMGIAHAHGGCITCENHPGRGATFHVYLPRAKNEAIAAAA